MVSIASAVGLCGAKFAVGVLTGSLGVLSSAFDSLADIFMSAVNLFSIRQSMQPPDAQHPYGHGKVEALATLFQGAVIAYTGVWVLREGYSRLLAGKAPESADGGIAVMLFGVFASLAVTRYLRRVGRETGSSVLVADALHFATDVYTNGGILFALVVYRFTGWKWIDPGIALLVGVYILYAAGKLLFEAAQELLDRTLPPETVDRIRQVIESHRPMLVDYHDLRTRRAGSECHVDFHVVLCREATVADAHAVADHLEEEIGALLGNAHVVTHMDPCKIECGGPSTCTRDGHEPPAHAPAESGPPASRAD
jgi:cation diffusion facilitator family transporter